MSSQWNGLCSLTAFTGDLNTLSDTIKSSTTVADAVTKTMPLWLSDSGDREVAFQFIASAYGVTYNTVYDAWK
jgi:hypothetical protein